MTLQQKIEQVKSELAAKNGIAKMILEDSTYEVESKILLDKLDFFLDELDNEVDEVYQGTGIITLFSSDQQIPPQVPTPSIPDPNEPEPGFGHGDTDTGFWNPIAEIDGVMSFVEELKDDFTELLISQNLTLYQKLLVNRIVTLAIEARSMLFIALVEVIDKYEDTV